MRPITLCLLTASTLLSHHAYAASAFSLSGVINSFNARLLAPINTAERVFNSSSSVTRYEQRGCNDIYTMTFPESNKPILLTYPAPSVFYGDVFISHGSQIAEYQCLQRINGSLSINDGELADLGLPNLSVINGDLNVTFDYLEDGFLAEEIDLSGLKLITGDLNIRSPEIETFNSISYDVGMPSLEILGGDLSIDLNGFSIDVSGLNALTSVTGNVFYRGGEQDGYSFDFLTSLEKIDGDLTIEFGGSGQHEFFNQLETVGGNLSILDGQLYQEIVGEFGEGNFRGLRQVLGSLHLKDVEVIGPEPIRLFEHLVYAQNFTWSGSRFNFPASFGDATLVVESMLLEDIHWLVDIHEVLGNVFFFRESELAVVNNQSLSECDVQNWYLNHTKPPKEFITGGNGECVNE